MIGPADFAIAEADLAADLPQQWRVTVTAAGTWNLDGPDSGLERVTITFDASRVPRVDATVVVATDPAVAETLSPNPGAPRTVTIAAGYGTGPLVTLAELRLDDADYADGREKALERIAGLMLEAPAGTRFSTWRASAARRPSHSVPTRSSQAAASSSGVT